MLITSDAPAVKLLGGRASSNNVRPIERGGRTTINIDLPNTNLLLACNV